MLTKWVLPIVKADRLGRLVRRFLRSLAWFVLLFCVITTARHFFWSGPIPSGLGHGLFMASILAVTWLITWALQWREPEP